MTNEQQKLVEENINLAYFVAHRFKNTSLEFDDVKAIACLGLVKAAIAFQPDRGLVFNTLAVKVMTNEILMQLRRERKHSSVTASLDMETVKKEFDKNVKMLLKLDWMGEHYTTFEDWGIELNQKFGLDFNVERMAALRDVQDEKSDTYQRLDRVTVINRLKEAGYVDAAEFLEEKMR